MAVDALLTLQSTTTQTGAYTGTPLILAGGTPRRNLYARVLYSAASVTGGTGAVRFGLDVSYDGGTTWQTSLFQSAAVALSTTAAGGEIAIPFDINPLTVANGTQVRLAVESISGTGATVTYNSAIEQSRP